MTILVTGKDGQLGSEFKELAKDYPQYHFLFTDVAELDITNETSVQSYFDSHHIDAVINCAAYTAVDKAESEPNMANAVNHLGVKYLAEASKSHEVRLVHISTDYVFDGEGSQPYKEADSPNPHSVYGHSKLDGELALRTVNPKHSIIIRTAWVYSRFGHNFVKTMLRLAKEREELQVVNDQIGSPTYAADLAKAILDLLPRIKNDEVETYHFTNSGQCSWCDFAKAIFEIKEIPCNVVPIPTKQYPTPAQRPLYSVLDTQVIRNQFNIDIADWETSLKICLSKLS